MPEMRINLGYDEIKRNYVKKIGDAQKEIDEADVPEEEATSLES